MQRRTDTSGNRGAWYALLLIPFVAILWVPFYASAQPEIAGIPYFYWYQFLWVIISAIITAVVYFATREPVPEHPSEGVGERIDRELA
jgi:Na+/melibiose symporter-like transporter